MFKIFSAIFLLMVMTINSHAFKMSGTYDVGPYVWITDNDMTQGTGLIDTANAVGDSVRVFTKWIPKNDGWDRVISVTTNRLDSVKYIYRIKSYDEYDSLIGVRTMADTFSNSSQLIVMPFAYTIGGYKYTMDIFTITGAGTVCIFKNKRFYKRKSYFNK